MSSLSLKSSNTWLGVSPSVSQSKSTGASPRPRPNSPSPSGERSLISDWPGSRLLHRKVLGFARFRHRATIPTGGESPCGGKPAEDEGDGQTLQACR
jgi:hypothetical protein